jgi:ubiquinone/menaquinone biosynthesis C-methylase UbiE
LSKPKALIILIDNNGNIARSVCAILMKNLTQTFQSDFDRIAALPESGADHNAHYHNFLLQQIPEVCDQALEIGCGTGAFSRLLAGRCTQVQALDLSPEMIRLAKERSRDQPNIEFQIADARVTDFPAERFACVASIATLHHLPMRETLIDMKTALKTGGVLIVLDLFESKGLSDYFLGAAAMPLSLTLRLLKTGRLRPDKQTRQAWEEHAKHDSFATLEQARQICAEILPGARVRRHLLWRYSIVWQKTAAANR